MRLAREEICRDRMSSRQNNPPTCGVRMYHAMEARASSPVRLRGNPEFKIRLEKYLLESARARTPAPPLKTGGLGPHTYEIVSTTFPKFCRSNNNLNAALACS